MYQGQGLRIIDKRNRHMYIIHTCIRIKDHRYMHDEYMHHGYMHHEYTHHGYMHHEYMHPGNMPHGYKLWIHAS